MNELGIDAKLLLGQIVNFTILLLILWRFAYKPIVKMLNDRREKISESLDNAKKIETELASTEEKTKEIIKKAVTESEKMIENAKKLATEQKAEIVAIAKKQAEKEIERAKEAIQKEKDDASMSLKRELAGLVSLATMKITKKQATPELQKTAIDEAVSEMRKK